MRSIASKRKDPPRVVVSAIVLESASRFRDSVVQLLHHQSAINHLLSHGPSLHPSLRCHVSPPGGKQLVMLSVSLFPRRLDGDAAV